MSKAFVKRMVLALLPAIVFFAVPTDLITQTSTAAPFLLFSPSAVSQGMGQTGVALNNNDAFSSWNNPANTGLNAMNTNVLIGIYPSGKKLYPSIAEDIAFSNYALNLGYNFGKDGEGLPLSVGVSYMYQYMNLGQFKKSNGDGTSSGLYESDESANCITIGAALDYWVKIGLGITYKSVNSYTGIVSSNIVSDKGDRGSADAVDIGLLAIAPLLKEEKIAGDFSMNLNASLGLSLSNFGSKMEYDVLKYKDFLPRSSSFGYGISAELLCDIMDKKYSLFKIDWTAETQDVLIRAEEFGRHYENAFSDLNFVENVILLNNPNKEYVKYGARLSLFETFHLMTGNTSSPESHFNETGGFGFELGGLLKLCASLTGSDALEYISGHCFVGYYNAHSDIQTSGSGMFDSNCHNVIISLRDITL